MKVYDEGFAILNTEAGQLLKHGLKAVYFSVDGAAEQYLKRYVSEVARRRYKVLPVQLIGPDLEEIS